MKQVAREILKIAKLVNGEDKKHINELQNVSTSLYSFAIELEDIFYGISYSKIKNKAVKAIDKTKKENPKFYKEMSNLLKKFDNKLSKLMVEDSELKTIALDMDKEIKKLENK